MSAFPLYAFTGLRGHGKTTAAEVLIEKYGYAHLNFADPLREVVAAVYGVTMDEMLNPALKEKVLDRYPFKAPRELLQQVGTNLFRNYIDDTWLEAFRHRAEALVAAGAPGVVCSDARFLNEAAMIHKMGGTLIRIDDPRKREHGATDSFSVHASEAEIDLLPADVTIQNGRGIENLHAATLLAVNLRQLIPPTIVDGLPTWDLPNQIAA